MPGEDEILDNELQAAEDNEVDQEPEESVEADEPKPKMVDKRALDEERAKRKELSAQLARAQEQMELIRLQALRMQEQYQGQGGYGQQQPSIDPEIQKGLDPYLRPLQQKLERAEQLLLMQHQQLEAQKAIQTLEQAVPDIDDYRQDVVDFLDDMDEDEKNRILSSPKAIAKIVNAIKKSKGVDATATAKKVVNSRAKSESGQSNNRSVPKSEWQDMKPGSKEFKAYLQERLGWDMN